MWNWWLQHCIKNQTQGSKRYGFGIRDPRSGKNQFRIPESRGHLIPDPQHSYKHMVTPKVQKPLLNEEKQGLFDIIIYGS
jgi:hypothetical protein